MLWQHTALRMLFSLFLTPFLIPYDLRHDACNPHWCRTVRQAAVEAARRVVKSVRHLGKEAHSHRDQEWTSGQPCAHPLAQCGTLEARMLGAFEAAWAAGFGFWDRMAGCGVSRAWLLAYPGEASPGPIAYRLWRQLIYF